MPTDTPAPTQPRLVPGLTIGPDDSRLLEELARFAERGSHEAARAALIFMGHVLRDAARRHDLTG